MNQADKQLPHSESAERAILANILLSPWLLSEAKRKLPIEHFYLPSHRRVFSAMLSLDENEAEITTVSIAEELKRENGLQAVGGISWITNLTYGVPQVSSLKSFITIVSESARRRFVIKLCAQLDAMAWEGDKRDEEIIELAIRQFDTVKQDNPTKRKPVTLEELANDQLLRLQMFFKNTAYALPTGFPELDNRLYGGGLVPSGLFILAAQTSIGKTTLALDIAANIAESGKRAYIMSREMPRESLFDRLIAAEADVDRWKIRPGIYESDYRQLKSAVLRMAGKPIVLDDVSTKVSDVRGYLREFERRNSRVDFLVIDYLQLLEAEGKRRESRNQEVGSISRALKGLAMEFQIPVLAISQITRSAGREKREPEIGDLRDSGELEQDADAVFFLFGDAPEEGMKFFNRTLKCAKQREGPLFREELPFNGRLVTYRRAEHFPHATRSVTGSLLDQGEIG